MGKAERMSRQSVRDNAETPAMHVTHFRNKLSPQRLWRCIDTGSVYLCRYENSCSFDLSALLTYEETVFYDLYIVDTNSYIYPVPVSISNYQGTIVVISEYAPFLSLASHLA